MSTLDDVITQLGEFNSRYPRPAIPALELSALYDLYNFSVTYPNASSPGVYVMFNADRNVLRIGKASCGRKLGARLTDYFKWGDRTLGRGVSKHTAYSDVRYIATIGLPDDRAFEAPAIEEYLLSKVRAPLNTFGVVSDNALEQSDGI